ncbi:MAG TPA: efflux RND transporter periplasmic adaptor subunit [Reyranella sp.]|nr:efflux RND transporter periplasmic adaptor subunit [Reyranella sp.]
MNRKTIVLAALPPAALAIAGALYLTLAPAFEKAAVAPVAPAPVPVVAGVVSSHEVPLYLRGVGTVIGYNTDVVRSQIQGQLTQIAFTEGQTVEAGDLLAQIDPRPYQAQLDQMTANRDRDQAQLANAIANLGRYTELQNKGYATPQLSDTQKAQVAQLQSAIKADEALIEQAEVQLSYTRLTSPIPGITGVRQIDVGNIIHPTDPNGLVVVAQVEPISLIFTLPQSELPRIQAQMTKGPLTVIAYSQDDKIKLDEGKLLLVNNQIAQTTGTIQLKATFPNAAHRLWPGQLVNARLLVDTRKDGLTIAAPAVQQGQTGSYVYVISPDGKAEVRPVTVAQISEGQALIDSGLKANETVVIDGQYRLRQDSPVRVLHGKAAKEADLQSAVEKAIP